VEKIIIDGKAGDRLLPYLPLERLKKPAAAQEEKKTAP
jgi:membrane protease subunit HflK